MLCPRVISSSQFTTSQITEILLYFCLNFFIFVFFLSVLFCTPTYIYKHIEFDYYYYLSVFHNYLNSKSFCHPNQLRLRRILTLIRYSLIFFFLLLYRNIFFFPYLNFVFCLIPHFGQIYFDYSQIFMHTN